MRGLTANEREMLATDLEYSDDDWSAIVPGLVALGRATVAVTEVDDPTDSEFCIERRTTVLTDLGSLALRVCPVEES